MMDKIRLGIIGCGGLMGASHLAGLAEVTDLTDITAVCDIDPEVMAKGADVLDGVMGKPLFRCTDYTEMVPYVDAVLVVLPHYLHYECGMFFARHKKHILMEKPMCNTEWECENLIEACEENGVTLMCAYPVRYWPEMQMLKELVDSGKYGQIFNMSIWTEQYTDYPGYGGWGRTARKLGGGQLFSHGCHYIDILLWFLGNPVEGVHLGTKLGTPWMEREGTSNVVMKFESGAMGYHFGTWGARGSEHGYCFQIHMTGGMLDYHKQSGKIILYENCNVNGKMLTAPTPENTRVLWKVDDQSKKSQYEIRHFLECVRDGKKPLTDGRSTLQGLRCIWKLYEAEENHGVADLRGLGIAE